MAKNVYIGVMGVTGSGKSSLISLCTSAAVKVGHNLQACTATVDKFSFQYNNDITVTLIDTPGFDDTNRSDTDVLRQIATWLGESYKENIKLSGIIYLHRITDPRMGGCAKRNLFMFKKLCGKDCFSSIILATTMWGLVEPQTAVDREKELINTEDFWGYMYENGSKVVRHTGDRASAIRIVEQIISKGKPITLQIQQEMVIEHRDLDQTGAGLEVEAELNAQKLKFQKEIQSLQEDIKVALKERDTESAQQIAELQDDFRRKVEKADRDREALKISLEEMQEEARKREREGKYLAERLSRQQDEFERQKQQQDRQQDEFERQKQQQDRERSRERQRKHDDSFTGIGKEIGGNIGKGLGKILDAIF